MKLFAVTPDDKFEEYTSEPFDAQHEERILENWLENNPDSILEDTKLLVIGRQVSTNLGGAIDLLALDLHGGAVIVELKRGRTPRETVAQALEYASYVEGLDYDELEYILREYTGDETASLAQYHREHFQVPPDEALSFNGRQTIVIVGQDITSNVRQVCTYLGRKGIPAACVEFGFFKAGDGRRLISCDTVVGAEATRARPTVAPASKITELEFLAALDDNGRKVFVPILDLAKRNAFPLHWGRKGLSINVDLGTHVVLCYGFPPESVFRQSLYTAFGGFGGVMRKTALSEEDANALIEEARATGLFQPAGRELKCLIDRPFSNEEVQTLVSWFEQLARAIQKAGLKSADQLLD